MKVLKLNLEIENREQKRERKQCNVNKKQWLVVFSLYKNEPFYRHNLGLRWNKNTIKFGNDFGGKNSNLTSKKFLLHGLLFTSSLSLNPFSQLRFWIDFPLIKVVLA